MRRTHCLEVLCAHRPGDPGAWQPWGRCNGGNAPHSFSTSSDRLRPSWSLRWFSHLPRRVSEAAPPLPLGRELVTLTQLHPEGRASQGFRHSVLHSHLSVLPGSGHKVQGQRLCHISPPPPRLRPQCRRVVGAWSVVLTEWLDGLVSNFIPTASQPRQLPGPSALGLCAPLPAPAGVGEGQWSN